MHVLYQENKPNLKLCSSIYRVNLSVSVMIYYLYNG